MTKKDFDITILSHYDCWNPDELMDVEYISMLESLLKENNIDCLVTLVYSKKYPERSYPHQFSVSVSKIDLEKTIELLKNRKHSRIKYREVNAKGSEYVKIGFHF